MQERDLVEEEVAEEHSRKATLVHRLLSLSMTESKIMCIISSLSDTKKCMLTQKKRTRYLQ